MQRLFDYNDGINDMNEFIQYRNKQFTPKKPDNLIQGMLDTVASKFNESKNKLSEIKNPDNNLALFIVRLNKSISDANNQLNELQDWLTKYLKK